MNSTITSATRNAKAGRRAAGTALPENLSTTTVPAKPHERHHADWGRQPALFDSATQQRIAWLVDLAISHSTDELGWVVLPDGRRWHLTTIVPRLLDDFAHPEAPRCQSGQAQRELLVFHSACQDPQALWMLDENCWPW